MKFEISASRVNNHSAPFVGRKRKWKKQKEKQEERSRRRRRRGRRRGRRKRRNKMIPSNVVHIHIEIDRDW